MPSTGPVHCRVHFLPYSRAFTSASRVGGKGPTVTPRCRQALPRAPYSSGPRGPTLPPKSKVHTDLSDFTACHCDRRSERLLEPRGVAEGSARLISFISFPDAQWWAQSPLRNWGKESRTLQGHLRRGERKLKD